MFRPKSNNHTYLLRSPGTGQLDVPRQHTRSLSLISCYVLLNEGYVNSYNIYVCLHQYELSHFQHVYNILAFKFKFSLFCNYINVCIHYYIYIVYI